jgi:hypothetical protein
MIDQILSTLYAVALCLFFACIGAAIGSVIGLFVSAVYHPFFPDSVIAGASIGALAVGGFGLYFILNIASPQ